MMRSIRMTVAIFDLLLGLTAAGPAVAQEAAASPPNGRFAALEAINASYQQQRHDLECRRITDLAALAEKSSGPEADAALRQLFSLAIAHGLCPQAQDAAQRCLRAAKSSPEVRALAALVQVLARTDKGEHDRAIADLKVIFRQAAAGGREGRPQDTDLALGVGEALLNRLIHDGRYDVARKLCEVACEDQAPAAVKDHFEDRLARIDLVGKPAPPIVAKDVDGRSVSLAELKGKVVLIDFWASWCPPCVAAIPTLKALSQKYQDRGFVILGINVDLMHDDVKETDSALPQVRRFLVNHRVGWINVLSGKAASDFAAAYRVEQIPASFLVGRDGTVVAVDQHGEMLERAVASGWTARRSRRRRTNHHALATIQHWFLVLGPVPGRCEQWQRRNRAQIGLPGVPENPTLDYFGLGQQSTPLGGGGNFASASGYVGNPFSTAGYGVVGGYGVSPYGYGVQTGQVASGYRPAGSLYSNVYQAARPQTTVAFQPLYNAITALPGWNSSPHRTRRRLHSVSNAPRPSSISPFDDSGNVMWPSAISEDASTEKLRQAAEDAVRMVVHESKSTGHASVRPVVEAKNKLSAFERKIVPGVKTKNATDGAAVEAFFFDLDKALDALTYRY